MFAQSQTEERVVQYVSFVNPTAVFVGKKMENVKFAGI
jgi:hypothetical protein